MSAYNLNWNYTYRFYPSRAQYTEDSINTLITDVRLATATAGGNEPAYYVEQCRCPRGYTGLSCEV